MGKVRYDWTDNPTESGASKCDTDVLNACLMHLKYSQEKGDGFPLFTPMMFDKVLQGEEAVGWALQGTLVTMTYPDAVNKIIEEYTQGTSTAHRGIPCIKGINGHIIADIDKKDAVDTLYFDTGIADIYVLDSVNKQFYLPRNKYFTQLTNNTDKVNDFVVAGVPNITGWFGKTQNIGNYHSANGALQVASVEKMTDAASSGNSTAATYNFNASLSNSIYGKSGTVQPQASLKLLYYKVGNTVVNESLVDVGNVLSELQLKADVDLTNLTSSGKSAICRLGIASDRYVGLTLGASGSTYVAPANGYVYFSTSLLTTAGYQSIICNNMIAESRVTIVGVACRVWLPVKKGDVFTVNYDTQGTRIFRFIYAEGEK